MPLKTGFRIIHGYLTFKKPGFFIQSERPTFSTLLYKQALCETVSRLQKTLIILAKAVDRQSNRLHPEDANSELDDLVKELLDK